MFSRMHAKKQESMPVCVRGVCAHAHALSHVRLSYTGTKSVNKSVLHGPHCTVSRLGAGEPLLLLAAGVSPHSSVKAVIQLIAQTARNACSVQVWIRIFSHSKGVHVGQI